MRGGSARFAAMSALVVTLLAGTLATAPAASGLARRDVMLRKVNHARAERGIARLRMSDFVVKLAQNHNVAMAGAGKIFHTSDLGYKLRTVDWRYWGENVGVGVSVAGLFRAYMGSPAHRANMLDRRFRRVGIAFLVRDGLMWSTMIFYG